MRLHGASGLHSPFAEINSTKAAHAWKEDFCEKVKYFSRGRKGGEYAVKCVTVPANRYR